MSLSFWLKNRVIGVKVGYWCGTVDPVEEKVGRDGVLVLLAEEQSDVH